MFLPENIDLAHSEKYILSIRLFTNGFSFCIYSPTDVDVFFYKETEFNNRFSYADNLKKIVFDLGFFSQVFLKTEVVVLSDRFTLVPSEFFEQKKAKDIFEFNFHVEGKGKETILHNTIDNSDFTLVYGMDNEVHAFLFRSLWNPVFLHQMTKLLPAFTTYSNGNAEKRCFVDFQDSMIAVCSFNGNRLLSANAFRYNDVGDALFYVVSFWEKLHLDQMADYLYLSGKEAKHKSTIDILKKLIKNIQPMDFSLKTTVSETDKPLISTDLKIALCG